MKEPALNRHPLSIAFQEWAVGEGREALNRFTLGLPEQQEKYLHNRIERAFLAGAKAQFEILRPLLVQWVHVATDVQTGYTDEEISIAALKEKTLKLL